MSTACHPLHDAAELFDPNAVKVVLDHAGEAMYFSRATIPWARDAFAADRSRVPEGLPIYYHIGIYGYRCGFLKHYSFDAPVRRSSASRRSSSCGRSGTATASPSRSPRIAPEAGVDTPEDLERVRQLFAAGR